MSKSESPKFYKALALLCNSKKIKRSNFVEYLKTRYASLYSDLVRKLYKCRIDKGGDPATGSPTATLLRLHPNHKSYRGNLPLLRVGPATSSTTYFRDVTGGVYKTRERIHRGVLIRDY